MRMDTRSVWPGTSTATCAFAIYPAGPTLPMWPCHAWATVIRLVTHIMYILADLPNGRNKPGFQLVAMCQTSIE